MGNYHFHALMSDIPEEFIMDTPDILDMYKGRKMFPKRKSIKKLEIWEKVIFKKYEIKKNG